jgi:hypothetical protein
MKTPVHKIIIVNSNGESLDVTNSGAEKSVPIGVESIQMNKTKDDYSQECMITIVSKYDLSSVSELESGDYKFINQLPTNDELIFGTEGFDKRYGHFDYEVGDMVYAAFGYEEENRNPEGFFGFVESIRVINSKKVVITLQNQAYLMKKIMYNFSQKEITIKELYEKLVTNYNNVFDDIYGPVLARLNSKIDTDLADLMNDSGKIDADNLIINVDYTMKNFRAENSTGVDILDMMRNKYFTRTNFFQFFGGKTYLLGGFFNLLSLQEESLPKDLKEYLQLNFVFKNYDLKYERLGLNNEAIEKEVRKQDKTLTGDDFLEYAFVLNKSLTWQEEKDVKININFKVSDRNNSEFKEVSYGDEGGESKTMVYYESKTDDELKKLAEEYIGEFKYTGYKKGSTITSFGYPTANVFDQMYVVEVYQNQSEKEETSPYILIIQKYNIEGVKLKYDSNGIKQTVNLGQLLSSNIKGTKGDGAENIFLAETTTYTQPIAVGEVPDATTTTNSQPESDYELLNKIRIDLNKAEGRADYINTFYQEFYEKADEIKNSSPDGFYSNTINQAINEIKFTRFNNDGLFDFGNTKRTIKEMNDLQLDLAISRNELNESEEAMESLMKSAETSLSKARSNSSISQSEVDELSDKYNTLLGGSVGSAFGILREVNNFNNEQ